MENSDFKEFSKIFKNAKILTKDEERILLTKIQKKDTDALDLFVKSNLKLVVSRVLKFRPPDDPRLMHFVGDGIVGLMEAIKRFDLSKGYKFSTYAVWWIDSQIRKTLKFFRRETSAIQSKMKTDFLRANKVLMAATEEIPTDQDVAMFLGWDKSKLRTFQKFTEERAIIAHNICNNLPAKGPSPQEETIEVDIKEKINSVLRRLKPVEEDIVRRRFGIARPEATLVDIAQFYDLSKERIRQMEAAALRKLFILLRERDIPTSLLDDHDDE